MNTASQKHYYYSYIFTDALIIPRLCKMVNKSLYVLLLLSIYYIKLDFWNTFRLECFGLQLKNNVGYRFIFYPVTTYIFLQTKKYQFLVRWDCCERKETDAAKQSHSTHLEVIIESVMLSDSYRLKHCLQCLNGFDESFHSVQLISLSLG